MLRPAAIGSVTASASKAMKETRTSAAIAAGAHSHCRQLLAMRPLRYGRGLAIQSKTRQNRRLKSRRGIHFLYRPPNGRILFHHLSKPLGTGPTRAQMVSEILRQRSVIPRSLRIHLGFEQFARHAFFTTWSRTGLAMAFQLRVQ